MSPQLKMDNGSEMAQNTDVIIEWSPTALPKYRIYTRDTANGEQTDIIHTDTQWWAQSQKLKIDKIKII